MNTYDVIVNQHIEGTMRATECPEIGDYATIRYYNCTGDVRTTEGIITSILDGDEDF